MDKEARIAFINAQTACMLAEMYGMIAENNQRLHRGEAMAFVKEDFDKLPFSHAVSWNQVIEYLNQY